jgi:hypothetical protein
LRDGQIRGNAFSNAKIYQFRDFINVGWPVDRMTRGEVCEVVAFQCFKDFTTMRCDESGSPVSVFGIVADSVSLADHPLDPHSSAHCPRDILLTNSTDYVQSYSRTGLTARLKGLRGPSKTTSHQ